MGSVGCSVGGGSDVAWGKCVVFVDFSGDKCECCCAGASCVNMSMRFLRCLDFILFRIESVYLQCCSGTGCARPCASINFLCWFAPVQLRSG